MLPLLIGSVAVNWGLARLYRRHPFRYLVPLGVGLNLLVLGVFKYADFLTGMLANLLGGTHQPWGIILPLGISFFTFQQISYLVDLRRNAAPAYRFEDYVLYVTFFPQLIAGPIVRHHEIIPQYDASPHRPGGYERASRGLVLLICGLFKKGVVADELAVMSDLLFAKAAEGTNLGLAEAWTALGAFSMQIYFDFSGYSDMAIGLALLFGLSLPFNFEAPYRALSIRDFWRRWHMTLTRFLRDYLYIPLGGSRSGETRTLLAIAVTLLLGGLWHGAAWTFVAWGGAHALAIMINHTWRARGYQLPAGLAWVLTFGFVSLAWVLFRANDFAIAGQIYLSLFGGSGFSMALTGEPSESWWLIFLALAVAALGPTSQRVALELLQPRRLLAATLGVVLAATVVYAGGGETYEFIYFQF